MDWLEKCFKTFLKNNDLFSSEQYFIKLCSRQHTYTGTVADNPGEPFPAESLHFRDHLESEGF